MIARIWCSAVAQGNSDAYALYMHDTGVAGYAGIEGNRGVWMLRRDVDRKTEFVMLTLWDSMYAVKAFAGDRPEQAIYYPEDEHYLIEGDDVVSHFEVVTHLATRQAIDPG